MSKFSTPSPSPLTNHTKLSGSVPETWATFTEMSSLSLYPLNCVDPDQLASDESIYCFPCSLMKLNKLESHVSECAMVIQAASQGLKYIKHTVIPCTLLGTRYKNLPHGSTLYRQTVWLTSVLKKKLKIGEKNPWICLNFGHAEPWSTSILH